MASHNKIPVVRQLLQLIYLFRMPFIRIYSGVQIHPHASIGPGLIIIHFGGVLITRNCEIGDNCVLFPGVKIVTSKSQYGPRIGRNFYAGVDTIVVGNVKIEDDVACCASSVVTRFVPRGAIVAGVPASIVRMKSAGDNYAVNLTSSKESPKWMEPE